MHLNKSLMEDEITAKILNVNVVINYIKRTEKKTHLSKG